jgi:NAD(P)-dependent dehydrogenase (short-subunit alcohol dehydrogenase family)
VGDKGLTINALCPGFVDTPLVDPALRTLLDEHGIRLIDPETVAAAAISAARSGENGKAWIVQPGREPLIYEFRGVPGPR